MNVILVGAAQSEQFIRAAAGGDDEGLVAKMSKVLRLFHDRHVGVPAAFARNVVQGFAASYPELSNPLRAGHLSATAGRDGCHREHEAGSSPV